MDRKMSSGVALLILSLLPARLGANAPADELLRGYHEDIRGEVFRYHSPYEDDATSLLVRSLQREMFIEWRTQEFQAKPGQEAVFVWAFGIDVNPDGHAFDLAINGQKILTFRNPADTSLRDWTVVGAEGSSLRFEATMIDKYEDFMGYAFLTLPRSWIVPGESLRISIFGESSGSRAWYMTFRNPMTQRIVIEPEPAVVIQDGEERQSLRATVLYFGAPATAVIRAAGGSKSFPLRLGANSTQLFIPRVGRPMKMDVAVTIPGTPVYRETLDLKPVRRKTLYLLHHSHVDIGYTHVQSEVEAIQWDNLEKAIAYAEASQNNPPEARFKWNTEVMWAVDSYLRRQPEIKRQRLLDAIRGGWIGLDGIYANLLTGLCRPEEMFRMMEAGRRISKECGKPLTSAMISDIPGFGWGLVAALAQNGVKYFSVGTNVGHRIGYILNDWADRPFYWVSPSGEESVLCWVAGKGYSWFHTGLGATRLGRKLDEKPILDYVRELERTGFPYDLIPFRYNIGSDNGPPDPQLAERVKTWNETYVTPRIVIATVEQAFSEFEARYGADLPAFRGDWTGHWEDGAASSALETAMNREAAERLVQAEILWTLMRPEEYPHGSFDDAWRDVLLFTEHTWGSWNSISEPDAPFTRQQWQIKKAFAERAEEQSRNLLEVMKQTFDGEHVVVYNTLSWQRKDLVLLSPEMSRAGDRVADDLGVAVPSQRLSTGELAFLAEVPALSGRAYRIIRGSGSKLGVAVTDTTLESSTWSLRIDPAGGTVVSACHARWGELVEGCVGWNSYNYVSGRMPDRIERDSRARLFVRESGPLLGRVEIRSDAPGCDSLLREITLVEGLDHIPITFTVWKRDIREPEGLHAGFPFRVPDGVVRLDGAWANFRPDADQLTGSCKNYLPVQRYADVSNQEMGVCWVSLDAPMMEIGGIHADPVAVGWLRSLPRSSTFFSYLMNNYWETNYRASQQGKAAFRYAVRAHGPFVLKEAEEFGRERSNPLIVLPGEETVPTLFTVSDGAAVTAFRPARDGKGYFVRLYNIQGKPLFVTLGKGRFEPETIWMSDPDEARGPVVTDPVFLPPFGIRSLRVSGTIRILER